MERVFTSMEDTLNLLNISPQNEKNSGKKQKKNLTNKLQKQLRVVKTNYQLLNTKKQKLKKTAYICSQEMRKYKSKLQKTERDFQEKQLTCEQLEAALQRAEDLLLVYKDKLKSYQKTENQDLVSLQTSFQSSASESLNLKLIGQNQEILQRFHKEQSVNAGLQEQMQELSDKNDKANKKIFLLSMEVNQLEKQTKTIEHDTTLKFQHVRGQLKKLEKAKADLETRNQQLLLQREKDQVACQVYEAKIDELMQTHGKEVCKFQDVIVQFKKDLQQAQDSRTQQDNKIIRIFESRGEDSPQLTQLKHSLIHQKQNDSQLQNLKSENAELKLELLHVKEQQMLLMNKYQRIKNKLKFSNLRLIKSCNTK